MKINIILTKFIHYQVSDNVYLFTTTSLSCRRLDMVNYKCQDVPELDLPSSMVDQEYHVTVKAGDHLYTLSKQGVCIFNSKNLNWQYFCHCKFTIILSKWLTL